MGFQEPSLTFRSLPGNPLIVTFVVSGWVTAPLKLLQGYEHFSASENSQTLTPYGTVWRGIVSPRLVGLGSVHGGGGDGFEGFAAKIDPEFFHLIREHFSDVVRDSLLFPDGRLNGVD